MRHELTLPDIHAHEVPVALYREIRATVTVLVGVTAEEAVAEAETEAAAE